MTSRIDLTPFGFTPTESIVYAALLGMGMASGYAVGKELNLARANVYQALNGLVTKGAAERTAESPQRFEAVTPATLLAQLSRSHADQLDRLESQLRGERGDGGTGLVAIDSRRSLFELALRTAARSPGTVLVLGDAETLGAMGPIWRKRATDNADTRLWVVCSGVPELPIPNSGALEPARIEDAFGVASVTILVTSDAAIVAKHQQRECEGHWTSHPLLVAAVRNALVHLTEA